MIRLTLWLVKTTLATLFVTVLTLGATGWVVGNYMQLAFAELNIKAPDAISIIQKTLSPLNTIPTLKNDAGWTKPNYMGELVEPEEEAPLLESEPTEEVVMSQVWMEDKVVAVKDIENRDPVYLTQEEIEQQQKNISNKDRLDILSLLMAKVPQTEVEQLFELISDGLVESEAEQINSVLHKYLNEEEFEYISQIIRKYESMRNQSN